MHDIAENTAAIAELHAELKNAITQEEKNRISGLISIRSETLNKLLDKEKALSGVDLFHGNTSIYNYFLTRLEM